MNVIENVVTNIVYKLIILLFLAWLVYSQIIKPLRLRKNTPQIRSQAVLISKTTEIRPLFRTSSSEFYLTFELPDGTRKDFCVDTSVYNTILEGEEGILTYHEHNDTRVFVSFQRSK